MVSDLDNRENLYLSVRVAFVSKGSSLHAWCNENGIAMPNARAALLGTWNGPKADALVKRIRQAARER
jgi:hypothetical protein